MSGADDEQLIDFAIAEQRILVTVDLDFGEIHYLSRRGQFGVIVVRVRPATVEKITSALASFLKSVERSLAPQTGGGDYILYHC